MGACIGFLIGNQYGDSMDRCMTKDVKEDIVPIPIIHCNASNQDCCSYCSKQNGSYYLLEKGCCNCVIK